MRFLLPLIFLLSCARHESQPTTSALDEVRAKRDAYVKAFSAEEIPRCDRVTFLALMESVTGGKTTLGYETKPGFWERDLEPCFPVDSSSQCSLDGYLSVLQYAVGNRDAGIPQRMRDYLDSRGWTCGQGPEGVTSILPLKGVIESLAGGKLSSFTDLTGFRGHLLASYIWLDGRISGSVSGIELSALDELASNSQQSPFFSALYHRFSDGNQDETIEKLKNFPTPYSDLWGSAPDSVIYAITVAILEGK